MTGTSRHLAGRQEAVRKQFKALGLHHSRSAAALNEVYSTSALSVGESEWDGYDHTTDTHEQSTTLHVDTALDADFDDGHARSVADSDSFDDSSDAASPSSSASRPSSPRSAPEGLSAEDFDFLQQRGLDVCTPLRELGRGGYGVVDLVQVALPSGRTVVAARKTIHSPLYGLPRYERELRGLVLCAECPFVVDVYAARTDSESAAASGSEAAGSFEFLLEYASNGSLQDMLKAMELRRRGKDKLLMPRQRLQYYAACILQGIAFIHARGQAHRDIKPHNVLMAANGRPMLADTDAMDACDVTKRAGTTSYQAPELWRASLQGPGYTTKLADMYSFGVTMVEMAAHPSISGSNARLQAVKDDPAGALPSYVPDDLRDLICGLLAPVPQRLCVDKAKQHPFFQGVDWDSLASGPVGFAVQLRPSADGAH